MPQQRPKIVYREEEEFKDVSSKDLSRSELIKYIFSDFIRGFYLVGCIFLDFLIIAQLYYLLPFSREIGYVFDFYFGGFNLYFFYILIIIISLEIVLIWAEWKIYVKHFRKKRAAELKKKAL